MPQTTALTIIGDAFGILNVFMPGASIPTRNANDALRRLNYVISSWKQIVQAQPCVSREVFDLVANQGGPTNPYTIGDGGDFDTDKPASQNEIVGVGLLLGGSSPAVEIPRAYLTDDGYQLIQVKDLSNALFTGLYYRPTFAGGLGEIQLWPVPDTADNDLVLYRRRPLAAFSSLQASYDMPDGYEEALIYTLALRLSDPYGRALSEDAKRTQRLAFQNICRANMGLTDLAQDQATARSQRYGYNIQTGTGGGGTS